MGQVKRFITLNKEDEKYCEAGATGYCKIEVKEENSKIKIFIQGLKKLNYGQRYRGYLAHLTDSKTKVSFLGEINQNNELEIEIFNENVLETGIELSKFDLLVICVLEQEEVHMPLYGCLKSHVQKNYKARIIQELKSRNTKNNFEESVSTVTKFSDDETNKFNAEELLQGLKQGSLREVSKILYKFGGFKQSNPFAKNNLKYSWWEIKDKNFIEEICRNNEVCDQFFNNTILKKLIREKDHFLFGMVSDSNDLIKYLSYGFPAEYTLKDQIYLGGFANFYPSDGFTKRNGESGYWVVHINAKQNNIIMNV